MRPTIYLEHYLSGQKRPVWMSLYHGVPLCVVLYRDRNGKTISRAFLNDLDTLPKGFSVEDNPRRKPQTVSPKKKEHEPAR